MKNGYRIFILLLTVLGVFRLAPKARSLEAPPQNGTNGAWHAARREINQTVWERSIPITNMLRGAQKVTSRTARFIQLGSGLNYFDPTTQTWAPSAPYFTITPTGAMANQCAHKVAL